MADLFDSTPLDERAIQRLQTFEPIEGYALAFSGGKDSIVLLDIARRSGVKFHANYFNTGLEFPGMIQFTHEYYPEVQVHAPRGSFFQLIKSKGLPTRFVRWCCDKLKHEAARGIYTCTGIRWAESSKRKRRTLNESCVKLGLRTLNPIIDWSDLDVWQYIRVHQLKVPDYYARGFHRIGCIACPMASPAQRQKELSIAPKYEPAFIRAAQGRIDCLHPAHAVRQRFVTGEAYFRWWMSDTPFTLEPSGTFDFTSPAP
jgi:phosphoadenosine phosphosulfate reductase